jgi:hypothetical protein
MIQHNTDDGPSMLVWLDENDNDTKRQNKEIYIYISIYSEYVHYCAAHVFGDTTDTTNRLYSQIG